MRIVRAQDACLNKGPMSGRRDRQGTTAGAARTCPMTKEELVQRIRSLAETQFFDRGHLNEGLEAFAAIGAEPPARSLIRCGGALWRQGRYYQAALAYARAPLDLVRDHLRACRVECLAQRQVASAVAIARIEGVCICEELKVCATEWRKQGHIRDAVAAYRAAGIDLPANEFRATALGLQLQGLLDRALDALEAAELPLPLKDLREWVGYRPLRARDPRLEMRVLRTLLRQGPHE